jgi:hypothetical protein
VESAAAVVSSGSPVLVGPCEVVCAAAPVLATDPLAALCREVSQLCSCAWNEADVDVAGVAAVLVPPVSNDQIMFWLLLLARALMLLIVSPADKEDLPACIATAMPGKPWA